MARKRVATEPAAEITAEAQAAPPESGRENQREYPPEPNPRAWAQHNAAGVQFRTRRDPYQAELVFNEKPAPEVMAFVKDNGFRWDAGEKAWCRPIGYTSQAQDRLVASRTYQQAVNMILEAKGLEKQHDTPAF